MTIPSTAPIAFQKLDPFDVLNYFVEISQGDDAVDVLSSDEDVASFKLTLSAEAVAAGLQLLDGDQVPVMDDLVIEFFLAVAADHQSSPIFDPPGVVLGVRIALNSTLAPLHKERTVGVRCIRQ